MSMVIGKRTKMSVVIGKKIIDIYGLGYRPQRTKKINCGSCQADSNQCDQIGRFIILWATF